MKPVPPMKARSWRILLLVLAMVLAFFTFLGSRGLNEPDEGRYAELGRETLESGNWLTPHLNGFEHFQKPPMIYWATALSFKIFGFNEWAARLPSTLAALGIVALTAWMASLLFGRTMALPAAFILASSFLFFTLARFLTPDMLMAFFITAAIACLVKANFKTGSPNPWRWGFFLAMGLGFLTKGPMALVIPISAALAMQYGSRINRSFFSVPWRRGLLLTFALSLSWFVVMVTFYPQLWDYFLGYELIKRFGSHAHGRSHPFWYFIPVFLIGFLPWIFFIPSMSRRFWERLQAKTPLSAAQWLLLGWTIPPFLVLSFSGSKLLTYLLPLFPAFALAMAYGWVRQKYSVRTLSLVGAASIASMLLVFSQAEQWNNYFGRQASIRSLAQHIRRLPQSPAATVFVSGVRTHGLEFYLGKLVSVTPAEADLVLSVDPGQQERLLDSKMPFQNELLKRRKSYGIARYEDYLKYFQGSGWNVLEQAGDFVLMAPGTGISSTMNRPSPTGLP